MSELNAGGNTPANPPSPQPPCALAGGDAGAITRPTNPMLEAALDYARRGFSVIPIKPRSKKPMIWSWMDYRDRRATEEDIRKWWSRPTREAGVPARRVRGLQILPGIHRS